MAGDRLRELELRRQRLQLRSAALRTALGEQARPLAGPLLWADRIRGAWLWLGHHPEVPLVAVAVVALLRPARSLRWASRLWWAWGVAGRVRRLIDSQRP